MKLSQFLMMHARGQGKTHHLVQLVQKLGGTLIVRNRQEAQRISREYGIKAESFDAPAEKFRGRALGITYVDPDAVGVWVAKHEQENDQLRKLLENTVKELDQLRAENGRLTDIINHNLKEQLHSERTQGATILKLLERVEKLREAHLRIYGLGAHAKADHSQLRFDHLGKQAGQISKEALAQDDAEGK
jgi:regulator of replication initiation timing